jgi:hypothetical protein
MEEHILVDASNGYQQALQNKSLTDADLTKIFAANVRINWSDKTLRRAFFTDLECALSSELAPYSDDCISVGDEK